MKHHIYLLPDPDKQKVAAKVFFDNFKVPNIVAVDGETLFPLAFQPEWDNHTSTLMVEKVSIQLLVWL